jgi:hypothetical protein
VTRHAKLNGQSGSDCIPPSIVFASDAMSQGRLSATKKSPPAEHLAGGLLRTFSTPQPGSAAAARCHVKLATVYQGPRM